MKHTCLSSDDVRNVHRCPRCPSAGGPKTNDTNTTDLDLLKTNNNILEYQCRKELICRQKDGRRERKKFLPVPVTRRIQTDVTIATISFISDE